MSITILEAMKLDSVKNFKLLTEGWGLDRKIEKVGILDYEMIDKIEGQFGRGDFVISSFLFARNDVKLLIEAIKGLIKDGVSGLGIKDIYYKELPAEIIEYANERSFPIFIFDNSVYFEDIITDIMDSIKDKDNYDLLETKVDIIIKDNLSKVMIKELASEINSSFKEKFIVAYCKEKKYIDDANIIRLLQSFEKSENKSIYNSVFKYRKGILIIFTYENLEKNDVVKRLGGLIRNIGIDTEKYIIGISNKHLSLKKLAKGIKESFYAVRVGEISDKSEILYGDIGVYKIIMPFVNEVWIKEFYEEIILPLKEYDEKYNTYILSTAIKYIENDGSVKRTSEELFQHDNTIRYRINKMKEILNMENSDGNFYEQLSIAIKIYKIFNEGL
ncbi:MAG: PucR family transcriptional regulator [Clostridia bacterium]|nr:PucR family transcriptional regulator [Clostridia bacterium]